MFYVQVPCATLHDVITVLVEKTEGMLVPLIFEEAYDKRICMRATASPASFGPELIFNKLCRPSAFVRSDHENGEKSVQQAPTNPATPAVPLKPGSLGCSLPSNLFALVLRRTQAFGTRSAFVSAVSLRLPAPDAERVSLEDEPLYLNDTSE